MLIRLRSAAFGTHPYFANLQMVSIVSSGLCDLFILSRLWISF